MNQVDLVTMHRMRWRHQLEISEVRRQHHQTLAGMLPHDLIPVMQSVVLHASLQAHVEKSRQPNVFRRASSEIDVGSAQDASALLFAALWKGNRKILHPDFQVTPIEAVREEC